MTVYSHSRLSCYEQCPQKFKFHYIDKVKTEEEETVEAFLGIRVHEALEKLYRDLQHQKENTLDELLSFVENEWNTNWSNDILIVNDEYGPENYLKMARKYISDYYKRHHPFTQGKTVALEELIQITLDDDGDYKLRGFIDRLTETRDGYYEIHDYKTTLKLPSLKDLNEDRQLSIYTLGMMEKYPHAKNIDLVWHFLAFDQEIRINKNEDVLRKKKKEIIKLIDQIEITQDFEPAPSILCRWCEYQQLCKDQPKKKNKQIKLKIN